MTPRELFELRASEVLTMTRDKDLQGFISTRDLHRLASLSLAIEDLLSLAVPRPAAPAEERDFSSFTLDELKTFHALVRKAAGKPYDPARLRHLRDLDLDAARSQFLHTLNTGR